jgi:integrase
MASLSKSTNGTYSIQFLVNGKRKTIYAGKMEPREANRLCEKVEELARIKNRNGRIEESEDLCKWLSKIIGTKLHDKLVNIGLVEPVGNTQLEAFVDGYIAMRTDLKGSSVQTMKSAKNRIVGIWGATKEIQSITKANVVELRASLLSKLSSATVARTMKHGRQFLEHAVDSNLIIKNPFAKMKMGGQKNPSRLSFIDRETSQKVLEACPNLQWRLIFSLARFGGLRIPSELVGLQWSDVLWAEKKIRVPSPKTEHIEGKEHRWIPLFPEITEPLERAWEEAKEGEQFIFPRTITGAVNLRKGLNSIIKKAGLSPWPKLFQNLRASRETELCQNHPLHVAAAWIGNSPTVAIGHYLTVLDSDYEKATTISDVKFDGNDVKTMHFSMNSGGFKTGQDVPNPIRNGLDSSVLAEITEEMKRDLVGAEGIEPPTNTV